MKFVNFLFFKLTTWFEGTIHTATSLSSTNAHKIVEFQ